MYKPDTKGFTNAEWSSFVAASPLFVLSDFSVIILVDCDGFLNTLLKTQPKSSRYFTADGEDNYRDIQQITSKFLIFQAISWTILPAGEI